MSRTLLLLLLLFLNALPAAWAAGPYNAVGYGLGTLAFAPSGPGFGQALSITEDASHIATSQWLRTPAGVLDFPANTPWTIEVRRFVWLGTGDPTCHTLIGHQTSDADGTGIIAVRDEGHNLIAYVFGRSQVRLASGVDCADGQPHSFALVYDGSVCRFYVDGTLRATSAALTYAPGTGINDDVGSGAGQMMYAWIGTVDEVAISNVAQYAGASYTQSSGPFAGNRTGLAALYHMDGNANDGASAGALAAGVPSQTANGDGTATLDAGTATGGSGNYTYQWYYRPGGDDDFNKVVVATGRTLTLTGLTNGVPRNYGVGVSDGTTLVTTDFVYAVAQKPLVLEFIGDSLTGGAGNLQFTDGSHDQTAPYSAGMYLQALLGGAYNVIVHNHGYGGSRSTMWRTDSTVGLAPDGSYTTVAAGAPNTLLNTALSSIKASAAAYGADSVIVPVCLGTNDPNTGDIAAGAAATKANLVNLIGALEATGAAVVLQDIPWRAGYGNTDNAARNAQFDSIVTQLGGPPAVYRGDKGAVWAYQQGHPEFYLTGNGPHDSQQYQDVRGALWGKAIAKAVFHIGEGRAASALPHSRLLGAEASPARRAAPHAGQHPPQERQDADRAGQRHRQGRQTPAQVSRAGTAHPAAISGG